MRFRALAVSLAAIGLLMVSALPGPASAQPLHSATSHHHAATYCYFHGGTYLCQYGMTSWTFPVYGTYPRQYEYWVVAPNHQVWTYWNNIYGQWFWTGMGGYVISTPIPYRARNSVDGWNVTLQAEGAWPSGFWCDTRGPYEWSHWSGWYQYCPAG